MKTTVLDAKKVGETLERLMREFTEFYWAVAWGSNGRLADELLNHKKKIKNIIFGVHFYQTDPRLLERLASCKNARVALNGSQGIFHPKVYFFKNANKAAAIVGSSNFTTAGVSHNIETALFIEGNMDDSPLSTISSQVHALWQKGSKIDPGFLAAYRLQHETSKRHQAALSRPVRINRPSAASTHPNLLTMSWRDYVAAVEHSPHQDRDRRLELLRKVRVLLNRVDAFSDLSLEERKAIAGVIGRKEKIGTDLGHIDWGWFGSMTGAGSFKNRIRENDRHLSSALEHIPATGEVTRDDYVAFIADFLRAFAKSKRQGRVPTASRLLAMKRPDFFVCVDKQNIRMMSDDLGFARSRLDFERYWTEIIEPITQSNWWQVRRPIGAEGQIWDGRAAMLDAIYYQPT